MASAIALAKRLLDLLPGLDEARATELIESDRVAVREPLERRVRELEEKLDLAERFAHGEGEGRKSWRNRATAAQDRLASLEAQLASAREEALNEAFGVIVEAFQGESHERHPALFRAYCAIADKLVPPATPQQPSRAEPGGGSDGWVSMPPDLEPASALADRCYATVDDEQPGWSLRELTKLIESDRASVREPLERRIASLESENARMVAALEVTSNELSMARRNLDAVVGSVDGVTESVIADRDKARERIASLEAQLASAPRWIPVEERLPEGDLWVDLCWKGERRGGYRYVFDGQEEWDGLWWVQGHGRTFESPSHWMRRVPLPEPHGVATPQQPSRAEPGGGSDG